MQISSLRPYLSLLLLLLALPLMGAEAGGGGGCSCRHSEANLEGSGGGVAASSSYSLNRNQIGVSLETLTSSEGTYQASSSVGSYLSQTASLSNNYSTHSPLSQVILETPPALKTEVEELRRQRLQGR